MISFKSFLVLLENRIEFLKKQHSDKPIDTSHDTLAQHKDSHAIIDHLSTGDPTPKKLHTQWIVNQYKRKNIRQEDVGRVHETLSNFEKYKGKLPEKDINKYKHISDLETHLEPHLGTEVVSNKQQKKLIKHEGADELHNDSELSVHKIKTKEAACHYGAGTKWCTAAKNNNMFDRYNDDGPLYVVHDKKNNRKYQFHFETRQFMDEQDRPVDLSKLTKDVPSLKKVNEFRNKGIGGIHFHDDKDKDAKVKSYLNSEGLHEKGFDRMLEDHTLVKSHHIDHVLNNLPKFTGYHHFVLPSLMLNKNFSEKHIERILDHDKIDGISSAGIKGQALQSDKVNHKIVSKVMSNVHEDHLSSFDALVRHHADKLSSDHISSLLNMPEDGKKGYAVGMFKHNIFAAGAKNITPEHIDKALDRNDPYTAKSAIGHPNASHENISKALTHGNYSVGLSALHNPNARLEHFKAGLNHENSQVRTLAKRKIKDHEETEQLLKDLHA